MNILNLSKKPEEFHYCLDEEYQSMFQEFFQFSNSIDDMSDVYDVEQVKLGMNYIMSKTSSSEWWKKILLKAASIFLSEDCELGLCVLLNYSYLDAFYKVFYCMEKNPEHENLPLWKSELETRIFDN